MGKRVMSIVGTRPEAIKMAPIIKRFAQADCTNIVVATAQHRELVDQVFKLFRIQIDVDLNIMQPDQSLAALTARLFERIDQQYEIHQPDLVLAQGDTTSLMVAAMCAFYRNIPFGHVEAGLRTGDLRNPFPEELNRTIATRIAALHFAPTQDTADRLKMEGVSPNTIFMTGNTVVDALLEISASEPGFPLSIGPGARIILLTAHRRENFGAPMKGVFSAVAEIVERFKDVHVVYPVHPNPNVSVPARAILGGHPRIHLTNPLEYGSFIAVLNRATLVMTDSGGVQEEAPVLGKPILILRNETERPEVIAAGIGTLVGTDPERILAEAEKLLTNPALYSERARQSSPFGDGHAAKRIVDIVMQELATLP